MYSVFIYVLHNIIGIGVCSIDSIIISTIVYVTVNMNCVVGDVKVLVRFVISAAVDDKLNALYQSFDVCVCVCVCVCVVNNVITSHWLIYKQYGAQRV